MSKNARILPSFASDSIAEIFTLALRGTTSGNFVVRFLDRVLDIGSGGSAINGVTNVPIIGAPLISLQPGEFSEPIREVDDWSEGDPLIIKKLKVVRSGTRFRLFTFGVAEPAPSDNFLFESDLPYSSFRSFGDFIDKARNGDFSVAPVLAGGENRFANVIFLNQSESSVTWIYLPGADLGDSTTPIGVFQYPEVALLDAFE